MKRKTGMWLSGLVLMFGAALALPSMAQQGGGGGGGGGGGRNFDPAQFQQRIMERIKEQLGATDDEWKAIEPKLDKLMTVQRESMGGRMFGFGGRRPGGNGGGDNAAPAPTNPVAQKAQDLQKTLDNKDAKPEEIKEKLAALREARTKAREDLTKARKELTELLTQRQEAILVQMGMLE